MIYDRHLELQSKWDKAFWARGYQRARPCLGAKRTPWLWTGGTKEVRTHIETQEDPGVHHCGSFI